MSSYKLQPMDSKREEFRKYLEKTGVLDSLTKTLVSLYEEPEKPEDALSYVQTHLGLGNPEDTQLVKDLRKEIADLKKELAIIREEIVKGQGGTGEVDRAIGFKQCEEPPIPIGVKKLEDLDQVDRLCGENSVEIAEGVLKGEGLEAGEPAPMKTVSLVIGENIPAVEPEKSPVGEE